MGALQVFFVLSVIIWENAGVHADKGYPKKPYGFGYNTDDGYGNTQHRYEYADPYYGGVKGSYGYYNADGVYRTVYYTADKGGFRAKIKTNEPDPLKYPQPKYPQPKYPQPKYPQPVYPKSYSYFHKYIPKYSKYPPPAYSQPQYPASSYPQPYYSPPAYPHPQYPPPPSYPQPKYPSPPAYPQPKYPPPAAYPQPKYPPPPSYPQPKYPPPPTYPQPKYPPPSYPQPKYPPQPSYPEPKYPPPPSYPQPKYPPKPKYPPPPAYKPEPKYPPPAAYPPQPKYPPPPAYKPEPKYHTLQPISQSLSTTHHLQPIPLNQSIHLLLPTLHSQNIRSLLIHQNQNIHNPSTTPTPKNFLHPKKEYPSPHPPKGKTSQAKYPTAPKFSPPS
ncbi:hypothetical protein HNY73_019855 [Argiope bruennichi]|uniref:Uncharacterized protein n=1 Tax=Argiope bruennichi TaxID=94029 RepID=A0A8T0E668_ARGBR|nr:hypothetical protein HNY73_019855 [Argiope bruennichi]